jgi:hypothetical protein
VHFSDVHFGLNRKLLVVSAPVSAVLSLAIDRALMQYIDQALTQYPLASLFLFQCGNAVAVLTFVLLELVVTAVLHAAWFLIQILGVLCSFVLTLGIMFIHIYFFEKSVDCLMVLKRHLEQSDRIDLGVLLILAAYLFEFALFATIAAWLHHKVQKRVTWLLMLGICLAAVATAYRSIAQ